MQVEHVGKISENVINKDGSYCFWNEELTLIMITFRFQI